MTLTPRPTKRGGYHPQTVCLQPHKNAKESDPGRLGHLFYVLCGHFDEKNRDRVSRQNSKVGGWLPPQNILSHHFEKYLHGMVPKRLGHVRNTISLLYKHKTG